jgi:hypothetical protein
MTHSAPIFLPVEPVIGVAVEQAALRHMIVFVESLSVGPRILVSLEAGWGRRLAGRQPLAIASWEDILDRPGETDPVRLSLAIRALRQVAASAVPRRSLSPTRCDPAFATTGALAGWFRWSLSPGPIRVSGFGHELDKTGNRFDLNSDSADRVEGQGDEPDVIAEKTFPPTRAVQRLVVSFLRIRTVCTDSRWRSRQPTESIHSSASFYRPGSLITPSKAMMAMVLPGFGQIGGVHARAA